MYATVQTSNQTAFHEVTGAIVDIKTIGKRLGIFAIFEMTIDCGLKDIDFDALQEMPDTVVKLDGNPYPDNWLTADSAALKNNAPSGGVHTSSMGDIYPIVAFRRGDVEYYQYGGYEIAAEKGYYQVHDVARLLRQGLWDAARERYLSQFWTKVK